MPRHPPCALTHLTTTRCSHPLCNTQHTTTAPATSPPPTPPGAVRKTNRTRPKNTPQGCLLRTQQCAKPFNEYRDHTRSCSTQHPNRGDSVIRRDSSPKALTSS